jgi:hypothetical protein
VFTAFHAPGVQIRFEGADNVLDGLSRRQWEYMVQIASSSLNALVSSGVQKALQPASTPKPTPAPPPVAASAGGTDADGDHDGTGGRVGSKLNVTA